MLEVTNLAVSYGRHRALEGVSLKVGKGEICVILGANGAGKSTLLKAVAGMVRADAGEVAMNGHPITKLKAHRIVEEGIALVPEGRGIFGDLTVAENLQLGAFALRARRDERSTLATIYDLFPRLAERKRQIARTMSGGEQQMVAIGRALMSKPDILMLDEPSLGLSPILTQELFRSLTAVAATGVGILLVEQNAKQSLKIAKRGYLIENGHVTGENSAEALRSDPAVIAAYLGGASGRAGRPVIHLPPPMRLPATLGSIVQKAGDLASRAASISQAFVSAMRRAETQPSAFVGRHDPKAGADPWAALAAAHPPEAPPPPPPPVAREAQWLASSSANLAHRASERLARHVAESRRGASVPSAFVPRPSETSSEPSSPSWSHREYPTDVAPTYEPRPEARKLNGSHGLIGHNSAAAGLDEDDSRPAIPRVSQPPLSIPDLAERAASIQKRHVDAQRNRVTGSAKTPAPTTHASPPASQSDTGWARSSGQSPDLSIAELASRAAAIQRRHVDEGRKLSALTVPPPPLPSAVPLPRDTGDDKIEAARDVISSPAKRGRGTTRSVVEGAAQVLGEPEPESQSPPTKEHPKKSKPRKKSAGKTKHARKGRKQKNRHQETR